MICDRCGTSVNPAIAICPNCGKVLKSDTINSNNGNENNNEPKKKIDGKIIFAIAAVVIFIILLLVSNSMDKKKSETAKEAETACQTETIYNVNYYGFSFEINEDIKYTITDKLYLYTDDFKASIGVIDGDYSSLATNKDNLSGVLIKQGYDMSQADISLRTYGKRQYIVLSNILLAGQNYDAIYTSKYDKIVGAIIEDSKGKEVTGKQKETVASVIDSAKEVQTASINNELNLPALNN